MQTSSRNWFIWITILVCGTVPTLGRAQNTPPRDMSDDPEVARQLMQLPEGFEAQLVASDPTIINPIQMNFDAKGRLFVLCVPRYPQILPGQEPKDYVVALENFGPDGRAKKARVVVEGLTVPTGIMPGDGGVYIGQAESLLHFQENPTTGKFDQKRIVLTGFGTADTHHTLNTFRWGPDGSLYFNQGVYIQSTVETPYGPRQLFGGAIWQLRTDRLKLEVYDRSILPNNTWGHAFDAWGQSFIASAWPGALNLVLPDSPLQKVTRQELVPPLKMTQVGAERHCGLEIIGGRHLPDDYQGNLLTGDFLSHRVYRYALNDDGQRYNAKLLAPLVVSKHRKFRPIDIKQGPDGAIYIADLYQQIIQHNQVDFRDPRRDHTRGRIWRIVNKNRPLLPTPKLFEAPVRNVLDELKSPEPWTRLHAKLALASRDRKETTDALDAWAKNVGDDDGNASRHRLEALWAGQTLDHLDPALMTKMLRSEDFRVRSSATRILGAWSDRWPESMRWLNILASDPHPRVRLEAVLALTRIPSADAVTAGMRALDQTTDPILEFSLKKLAILHKPYWHPEFLAGRVTFDGNARRLAFALQAIGGDAVPTLVALIQKDKVPGENLAEILRLIALLGNGSDQSLVFEKVRSSANVSVTDRIRILDALAQAMRERNVRPAGNMETIADWFDHADPRLGAAAIQLAGQWKLESLRNRFLALANDRTRLDAAISALVNLGGPKSIEQLQQWANETQPWERRHAAVTGLATLDVNLAAKEASTLLKQPLPAGADPSDLFTAFLQRRNGSVALANALKAVPASADASKVGLRILVGLGVPAPELNEQLQTTLGKAGLKRTLDANELPRWVKLVRTQGDPARGESVFRRAALGCQQCHALGGAGGRVGPDLSGIGTSAQLDYLIESVILPSKIVREGYNTAHVTTVDGRSFSGVVKRETPQELVLADPIRDEIILPTKNIDEKRTGGSLMPDGLDQSLTDAELGDLIRFLSELGKPGPFGVTHQAVARRWRVREVPAQTTTQAVAASLEGLKDAGTWKPLYATVSGDLPGREIHAADGMTAVLQTQFEVVSPGAVSLKVSSSPDAEWWIQEKTQPSKAPQTLDLPRGTYTVVIRLSRSAGPPANLRLEFAEVSGSKAQVKFIDGK